MRKLATIIMLAAAGIAAFLLPFLEMNRSAFPPSINRALFFPAKYPTGDWSPADLRFADVYFTTEDNCRLHGWFCPVEQPLATILIVHGNAGNVATRVPLLLYLQRISKVSVFIFDYRGYGRSDGVPDVDDIVLDAMAARAKLCELASVKESEIILMGESLGGAIAVQLAAKSLPRALVLQSTFSSLKDLAEVHYPQHASLVSETVLDSVSQISRINCPLFQSHGKMDRTIPYELGNKLFSAAIGNKTLDTIPDADHDNWLTDKYLNRLDKFIVNLNSQ